MKAALHIGLVLAALLVGSMASPVQAQQRAAGQISGSGYVYLGSSPYYYESFGSTLYWIYGPQGTQVTVIDFASFSKQWDANSQTSYYTAPFTSYETGAQYHYVGNWRGAFAGHLVWNQGGLFLKADYRNYGGAGDNWQPVAGSYLPVTIR